MYVDPRRATSDELVQHAPFLERLAIRLTRDPDLAGDLVQDTWLAALRNPPRREGRVRAWLATVMRHLHINHVRGESRARERNSRLHLLPEECSSDERAAVFELRARLEDALGRLEHAQREVLVLRYLDGLPPREIARRLGLPVETVRTRVKRGAERLRAVLRQPAPTRRSRIAGLVLLARRPLDTLRSLRLGGRLRLRGALACACALLGLAWLRWAIGGSPAPRAASVEVAETPGAEVHEPVPPGATAQAARAALAQPGPTLAPGRGLQVRLRWAADDSVAAHIPLALQRVEGTRAHDSARVLQSDAGGLAELPDAPPGRWTLIPWTGRPATVDLPPGQSLSLELRLPPGCEVEGNVLTRVRSRVPPWVEIQASFPGRPDIQRSVLLAGPDGHFVLHGIDEHAWIGAFTPGYAPSALFQAGLEAESAGQAVPLELELGRHWKFRRELRVRVQDASQRPIAAAEGQLLGDGQARLDAQSGRWFQEPDSEIAHSGADGLMTLAREPGGREALCVRAAGFAPQWIPQEPGPAIRGEIVVVLQRESAIRGRLLAADPALALEGVRVSASAGTQFRPVCTNCDADGTFRLGGLPPGTVRIEAGIDDGRPGAGCADVLLHPAQECSLLLPFSCDGTIQGVIVDEGDRPRAGWTVALQDPEERQRLSDGFFGPCSVARSTTADGEGRFVFEGCAARDFLVCVHPPARAEGAGVHLRALPSSTPLRILAASHAGGTVRGSFDDPDPGRGPRPRLMLASRMLEQVEWLAVDPRDGAFACAGLPDGDYMLGTVSRSYGVVPLSRFALGPDAVVDLGRVAPPRTGRLLLRAHDRSGAVPAWIQLSYSSEQLPGARLPLSHPWQIPVDPRGQFEADQLGPGKYDLRATLPDGQIVRGTALVEAGESVEVELKP